MRILQLIDSLDAGGAERMAVNIANGNAVRGIQSYLCATGRSGPLEAFIGEDVEFLNLSKKRKIDLTAFIRFFKYVKNHKIEIIHAHSTSIQLAVLTKIRFPKCKIIWHDHYGFSDRIEERSYLKLKIMALLIDLIIAVNDTLAQWSKEVLLHKNVFFLNNFSQQTSGVAPYTFLSGIEGKRVVCIANLRLQKNHKDLIKSFAESIKENQEWTLHLIGKSYQDSYSQEIDRLIKELGMGQHVYQYGSRNDISHILSQATVGVLSSSSEGLPVSLLEYGLGNLSVIVTNVGQCADVVGTSGMVINNVLDEMADALIKMYNLKIEDRKLMGSLFYQRVNHNYSKESFFKQLIPIYRSTLS